MTGKAQAHGGAAAKHALPDRPSARTRRLSIRTFEARDFEAWRSAQIQSPPSQGLHDPGPRAAAELTRRTFGKMLSDHKKLRRLDRQYAFGIFDRAENTLYGRINLLVPVRLHMQLAWIGYLVFAQHRRKGYAVEACEAALKIAFRDLAFHRVEAGIEPGNRASIALAKALGMRREGRQKRSLFTRDAWVDMDVYGVNAEAFGIHMKPAVRLRLLE